MSRPAAAMQPTATSRRRRRPYRYALALVLPTAASIIFTLIYTIFANREHSELIRTEIADQLLRQIRHDLIEFLATLGCPSVSPADLTEQRDKYRAFIARFAGALTAIGASG